MRTVLFILLTLLLLLVIAVGFSLRDSKLRVDRETALATSRVYAQHVFLFCQASNRLPSSASELADYVFGNVNWNERHSFDVVNDSNNVFCIGTRVEGGKMVRMHFQVSPTGAVLRTVSPP